MVTILYIDPLYMSMYPSTHGVQPRGFEMMGTIDTIPLRARPITIAGIVYKSANSVPFRVWARVLVAMIVAKLDRRRTRIQLSKLTESELRDIGITPAEADREIRRSLLFYERHRIEPDPLAFIDARRRRS
ncbi:DUF1127 domain-containing protein [Oceaniradius stylonematis]|uniref:DUF1127 domain-containing protein n=1 Tax=Oceaniradius stylonematis TaxID=2184161 RepID=UPI003C7C7B06